MKIGGRYIREPRAEAELMPLATLGLPPLLRDGRPQELVLREGHVPRGTTGNLFGDASGVGKVNGQAPEVITWAVATVQPDGESLHHRMAGVCSGWYPSVAKGELQAFIEAMEAALAPATYVGDCQYVTDALSDGIPKSLASSRSPHADMWRRARRLLRDRGHGIDSLKIKAHRSQSQAMAQGDVDLWHGNAYADVLAKGLALKLWEGIRGEADARAAQRDDYLGSMVRSGICARLAQKALDALKLPKVSAKRTRRGRSGTQCGEHALEPRPTGGGQWCSKCKLITRTATSFKTLAAKPCRGEVLLGVHPSHQLRWAVCVCWCEKCGYYMSRLPRALRQPCSGAPRSGAARNVLRRLRSGLPPTTAAYLRRAAADDDWAVAMENLLTSGGGSRGPLSKNGQTSDAPHQTQDDIGQQATRGRAAAPSSAAATTPGERARVAPRLAVEKVRLHRDEIPGDDETALRRPAAVRRDGAPRDRDQAARPDIVSRHAAEGPHDRVDEHNNSPPPHGALCVMMERRIGERSSPASGQTSEYNAVGVTDQRQSPRGAVEPSDARSPFCQPGSQGSWSSRIAPTPVFIRRPCHICQGVTRSRCRGCRGPRCMACAKGRRACPSQARVEEVHCGNDAIDNDQRPCRPPGEAPVSTDAGNGRSSGKHATCPLGSVRAASAGTRSPNAKRGNRTDDDHDQHHRHDEGVGSFSGLRTIKLGVCDDRTEGNPIGDDRPRRQVRRLTVAPAAVATAVPRDALDEFEAEPHLSERGATAGRGEAAPPALHDDRNGDTYSDHPSRGTAQGSAGSAHSSHRGDLASRSVSSPSACGADRIDGDQYSNRLPNEAVSSSASPICDPGVPKVTVSSAVSSTCLTTCSVLCAAVPAAAFDDDVSRGHQGITG